MAERIPDRSISDAWFHRIKAATRDLVKACGGIERAAEVARVGKSSMGRFQHAGDEDIISLPAALALEAECGQPYVTRIMADLNGRGLTDPEATAEVAGALTSHFGTVLHEFSEFTASFAAATADGVVSPAEAEMVDRDIADIERALGDMRRRLAMKKAGASVASLRREA